MTARQMLIHGIKYCLPDKVLLSLYHRRRIGRFPNLRHPATFNEKVLQRCLAPDPRYSDLSDKLKVRAYVADKIGEKYLIPLFAAPSSFSQRDFDALPSTFVMKANHGCGFVKLVGDKRETSFEALNALAQRWLSTNFFTVARERHYQAIERRIFFEKLLLGPDNKVPPDIKIHVFNRNADDPQIFILVISDRFGGHPRGDIYDAHWNRLDIKMGHYTRSDKPAPRPHNLDEILWVARTLASDFDFVRVDLYNVDDHIYFGELTFTPGAGLFPLTPDSVDYEWGRLM